MGYSLLVWYLKILHSNIIYLTSWDFWLLLKFCSWSKCLPASACPSPGPCATVTHGTRAWRKALTALCGPQRAWRSILEKGIFAQHELFNNEMVCLMRWWRPCCGESTAPIGWLRVRRLKLETGGAGGVGAGIYALSGERMADLHLELQPCMNQMHSECWDYARQRMWTQIQRDRVAVLRSPRVSVSISFLLFFWRGGCHSSRYPIFFLNG